MDGSAQLGAIAARHQLGLIALFGSRARGVARPTSDADLGVLRADGRRLGFRELSAILSDLTGVLPLPSPTEIDIADLATDDAIFRREVARDGRPLFQDRPGRWVEFVGQTLIDYADIAMFVDECIAGVARAAAS